MIKIGSTTINKIKLGPTTINKVFLGANQVYPMGAAPPTDLVLEGFETISGGLPNDWAHWYIDADDGTVPYTKALSASNVTQGSNSYRVTHAIGAENSYVIQSNSGGNVFDLSAYSSVKLDGYIAEIPTDAYVSLVVFSATKGGGSSVTDTSGGATGAFTLTADITGFSSKDDIFIHLSFTLPNPPSLTAIDFYWDNLRAVP